MLVDVVRVNLSREEEEKAEEKAIQSKGKKRPSRLNLHSTDD